MIDPPPPVEIAPPDVAPYRRGNTGVDYVTTFAAGAAGPHVLINGLIHGNELCGAIAIDRLFRMGLRPARGRLTLALANVDAFRAFDPRHPFASRFVDEDMNRLWSAGALEAGRSSAELRRARALRPVYAAADWLLDLHSMTNDSEPLTLCGQTARARALARSLEFPHWVVADGGHSAGLRLIDHAPFADPDGRRTAILVECGQHWRRETAAVALESCLRFLLRVGTIDAQALDPGMLPARPSARPSARREIAVTHAVTVTHEDFTFTEPYVGLEIVPRAGTPIAFDGGEPVVTPYDDCVLVMPARRAKPGQTAVRLGRLVTGPEEGTTAA